ncbi:MAG: four helix bundle protein [Chloroflexi bacterium]|nr:four helix bundle protein [Chloroflexota bacterium]
MTSQIRRSSRSVCLNLREAWAKRRYEAHFISKLTDCDGENSETDSSSDFAHDCGYISDEQHAQLTSLSREVGKMLGSMIKSPGRFLISGLWPLTSGVNSHYRRCPPRDHPLLAGDGALVNLWF